MNDRLSRALLFFYVGCLVATGTRFCSAHANTARQGAGIEPADNSFDPLKVLTSTFPNTIEIKNKAHLLEFCPDGTCDGFVVSGEMPVVTLRDFAFLYEYFFSDYTYLGEWRARQDARNAAVKVLSKAEYQDCKHDTDQETARCVLSILSRNGRVRLIFVRYDEKERHVVRMDLAKQLSENKPVSK
jgi:hypothetical protein